MGVEGRAAGKARRAARSRAEQGRHTAASLFWRGVFAGRWDLMVVRGIFECASKTKQAVRTRAPKPRRASHPLWRSVPRQLVSGPGQATTSIDYNSAAPGALQIYNMSSSRFYRR